ncbi:MAG: hypothetical protein E7256_06790 [Lachnospiraceae bacterium]|nr:hypothetical protein [Lachnospiraceae bacterium]
MKNKKSIFKGIAMITQIGISIMVPVFLCLFIGKWLDSLFHTSFITILFLFLGFAAAFRNVYLMTRTFYANDQKREHEEWERMHNMGLERRQYVSEEERRKKEMHDTFEQWKSKREQAEKKENEKRNV